MFADKQLIHHIDGVAILLLWHFEKHSKKSAKYFDIAFLIYKQLTKRKDLLK